MAAYDAKMNVKISQAVERFNEFINSMREINKNYFGNDADCLKLHVEGGADLFFEILYKIRRIRDEEFGVSFFGEPSWDILVDLYFHQKRGRPVFIKSSCLAACVPPTTALRYIAVLESSEFIERYDDPSDGRRTYLKMTDFGMRKMENIFNRFDEIANRRV